MVLYLMTVTLHIPNAHSLKDKRGVIKGLIERLQQRFKLAVAESGRQDEHRYAEISVACLAAGRALGDSILDKALDHMENTPGAEVVAAERELR